MLEGGGKRMKHIIRLQHSHSERHVKSFHEALLALCIIKALNGTSVKEHSTKKTLWNSQMTRDNLQLGLEILKAIINT